MTRFCQSVFLPDPLVNRNHLAVNDLLHWTIPISDLSVEFHQTLSLLNVRCYRAQLFRRPAGTRMSIHIDGNRYTAEGKLNFIYNGENSVMRWYEATATDTSTKKTNTESGGQPYILFNDSDCKLLYEKELIEPHLVEVGIPHNIVSTNTRDRYCLSLALRNEKSHRLLFSDLVDIFRPYIRP